MNWLETKYIGMMSTRLRNFKRKSHSLYNFSCNLCGDSEVDKRKARAGLPISETMAQLKRRRRETGLGVGVLRMNGQGEKAIGDWVAILTFDDLIHLLKAAGYGAR